MARCSELVEVEEMLAGGGGGGGGCVRGSGVEARERRFLIRFLTLVRL